MHTHFNFMHPSSVHPLNSTVFILCKLKEDYFISRQQNPEKLLHLSKYAKLWSKDCVCHSQLYSYSCILWSRKECSKENGLCVQNNL